MEPMTETDVSALTEIEALLKSQFNGKPGSRLPSTALEVQVSDRADQLLLPDGDRGKMPFTKDKFLVRENPHLVQWERETRKFLRRLSPEHGHRVSAAMVYEWCTGIKVQALVAEGGSTVDLKRINKILRFYYGKPYMTWICGRKVPNCFRVNPGYYITKHRPMTLTLYAEYAEGALYP